MVNLSKSKYCALWQCPKMLWLRKYKPELAEVDSHTLSIMETGNAAASRVYRVVKGRRGVTDSHTSSCIPKTTRWARGSKKAAADEKK